MVATIDGSYVRYIGELCLQPTRKEIIEDLGDMLKKLLNRLHQITGKEPQKILVYRNGVSEDMYATVKSYEIGAIKSKWMLRSLCAESLFTLDMFIYTLLFCHCN